MCPEDVRLDLTGADEFLVVCQSPPPYGSVSDLKVSPYSNDPQEAA